MMIKRSMLSAAAIAAVLAFGFAGSAQAITVSGDISVNAASSSTETQIFLDLNASTSSGTGHIGSQTGNVGTPAVSFVTDINASFSNGFADINALNNTVISTLTISVPLGWAFTDLDFSTQKADQVTVTAKDGGTVIGTASGTGFGDANTGWLVQALNGKEFTSIVLTSTDGFDKIRQFQISGLTEVCVRDCPPGGPGIGATPLPAALPLFASGLGAFGFVGWRRKRKAAVTA